MANKANRRDWDVLDSKINQAQDEHEEFKNNNPESKNRSKAFTAVAVSAILDIDMDEAIDAITDGEHDRGIDAIYIDDTSDGNHVHLFQMKCKGEFKNAHKNFPSDTIGNIVAYLTYLGGNNKKVFKDSNDRAKQKTFDAIEALRYPRSKIIIHLVGNMDKMKDNETKYACEAFKQNDVEGFEMHDLKSLADLFFRKDVKPIDRKIKIRGDYLEHKNDNIDDIKGLVCTVAATDIVEMIALKNDSKNVDYDIFDKNVRVYLKQRNKINKNITASAIAEDNHMFWYQNNGITMTCDEIISGKKVPSRIIELKNVQIVNGGQTSNSLFEAAKTNPKEIEGVLLLVRIIETNKESIKGTIAESTNSQTPITSRDLRANDRGQRQLQDIFFDMGYFYECKAREFEGKEKDRRIDALSAGQAYLAYGLEKPEVAKANRGYVFGNLYDIIFTEDLTPKHLLISMRLLNLVLEIKSEFRIKIKNNEQLPDGAASLTDGAFHALFAIRKVLEKKGLDVWSYEEGKKCIDEAVGVIYEIYKDAKLTELNFSSNRFFKDTHTKKLIADRIERL